jgi:hypothetical protein
MTVATEARRMAGRRKESFDRGRVEFKAPEDWIRRANGLALRMGFGNLSAFIRFVVTQYMNEHAPEEPPPPPAPKKGGK